MQGKAETKANPVDFFWIESHADFTVCMEAVGQLGYSSTLTSTVGADGQLVWALVLNNAALGQVGVEAKLGEVISWDGTRLTVFPNSDAFLALHNLVG